jgi:hypothetical protein
MTVENENEGKIYLILIPFVASMLLGSFIIAFLLLIGVM